MSMFDVAKYLYFSRSIDLADEGDRFFNLSSVGSQRLHFCLQGAEVRRDLLPQYMRAEERQGNFTMLEHR